MNKRRIDSLLSVRRPGFANLAAEEMGVAQPALNKKVQQLEQKVETKLFELHSRGVTPENSGILPTIEATGMIR